jgi:DNA repair exonuclease SbcCD ATPase subunit
MRGVDLSEEKVEIMYFYSDVHENEKNLSEITRKLGRKRKDIEIRLVNVDDPGNEEITELYGVNMVPLIIFLTPKGQVAAKRFLPLSAENVVQEITDQINKGELPNPMVEETRTKILEALKATTKRSELTDLVVEQIESDLEEANVKSEIYELVSSHISAINHAVSDLQELRRVLQRFSKKHDSFVV